MFSTFFSVTQLVPIGRIIPRQFEPLILKMHYRLIFVLSLYCSWAAIHYICPLSTINVRPYAVSIVTTLVVEPLNVVKINYPEDRTIRNYTVCLHNAFNFKTDVSKEIVEWVELHTLLGADHFVVYNYSSHPQNEWHGLMRQN